MNESQDVVPPALRTPSRGKVNVKSVEVLVAAGVIVAFEVVAGTEQV